MIEQIDCKYLGFTIVLLLIIYFLIANPKHIKYNSVSFKNYDNLDKNNISIFNNGKIEKIDPNLLIIKLNRLKCLINKIKESPIQNESHKIILSKFLKTANLDMSSYINLNINKSNINKSDISKILDEKLLEQLYKNNIIKLENDNYNVDDRIKLENLIDIIKLENYIDIIIMMISSSNCKYSVFNFALISELLNILNKIENLKTEDIQIEKNGSIDEYEQCRRKNLMISEPLFIPKHQQQIRHVDESQTRLDKTTTTGNNQKIKKQNINYLYNIGSLQSPEYNSTSHSSTIQFKHGRIQPGISNNSSGSYAYNLQFDSDKLLDNNHKTNLYD
jgi:ribosomal protein S8E/predicted nucleic-acid-binding Zn-ribbon protein